jgi:predicted nucleotidyltransferase
MTGLSFDAEATRAFCERNHVRRLSLFGSALRGELTPESDVDILVEFDPAHVPGLFRIIEMEETLSALFGGKADLRTPGEISRYFRAEVIRDARLLYEAA